VIADGPPPTAPAELGRRQQPTRRRVVTIGLSALVLAMAVMWVYVLFFAKADSPDQLAGSAWPTSAQAACQGFSDQITALPAARTAKTPQQRAAMIDQGNQLVAAQVAALTALPPPTVARDATLVTKYLADWSTYLANRRTYADDLRAGKDEPFSVAAVGSGGPITERMDAFSNLNSMPACVVPLDV